MLSSGEFAKECQVSVRTVQFYDKKGLVKPSVIQEGNRRKGKILKCPNCGIKGNFKEVYKK